MPPGASLGVPVKVRLPRLASGLIGGVSMRSHLGRRGGADGRARRCRARRASSGCAAARASSSLFINVGNCVLEIAPDPDAGSKNRKYSNDFSAVFPVVGLNFRCCRFLMHSCQVLVLLGVGCLVCSRTPLQNSRCDNGVKRLMAVVRRLLRSDSRRARKEVRHVSPGVRSPASGVGCRPGSFCGGYRCPRRGAAGRHCPAHHPGCGCRGNHSRMAAAARVGPARSVG